MRQQGKHLCYASITRHAFTEWKRGNYGQNSIEIFWICGARSKAMPSSYYLTKRRVILLLTKEKIAGLSVSNL